MTGPPARRIAAQVSRSPQRGSMPIERARARDAVDGRRQLSAGREQQRAKAGDVVVEARRGAGERAGFARGANVRRSSAAIRSLAAAGRGRPSALSACVTAGRMRATSVSTTPRASMAPIGTTKHAARKTNSGSTSSRGAQLLAAPAAPQARGAAPTSSPARAAVACVAAAAPRSMRAPAAGTLLGDPGVEALVQLVEVLEPELVVDRQRATPCSAARSRGSAARSCRSARSTPWPWGRTGSSAAGSSGSADR